MREYVMAAKIFKALCDPNRLIVMEMLQSGEKCACILQEKLSINQSTLSHHMKVLCDAELVAGRKEGKWIHYSLSGEGCRHAHELLERFTGNYT